MPPDEHDQPTRGTTPPPTEASLVTHAAGGIANNTTSSRSRRSGFPVQQGNTSRQPDVNHGAPDRAIKRPVHHSGAAVPPS
jgi:hypothetical protein